MNAAHAGVSKDIFESVLSRFNCVAQLENRTGYQVIIDYVGQERFAEICSPERLDRVYVVKAQGGANLRASPSMDGEKVGTVAQGSVAIDGELHGEWIKVKTYAGEGYMHESTLRAYGRFRPVRPSRNQPFGRLVVATSGRSGQEPDRHLSVYSADTATVVN
jgi:hypothetical protein